MWYPLWVLKVFLQALWRGPRRVHALGLESSFPVALAGLIRRRIRLVHDDADRMSQCYVLPKLVMAIMQALERWTARRSWLHVIPGTERYPDGLPSRLTVLLKNTPSAEVLAEAKCVDLTRLPRQTELVLYLNGWICANRGAAHADALACAFADDQRFHLLATGRMTGEDAQRLVKRRNVTYLGEVPNAAALGHYRAADLVLTYYDPKVQINRYAEPNKWGDCAAMGPPFVVNEEVVTARPWLDADAAFSCPFVDHAALVELIRDIMEKTFRLRHARQAMQALRTSQTDFDVAIRERVIPELCSHETLQD